MRRVLLVLLFGSVLAGCKSDTFVGRTYSDFTAYYNTFYNAQKGFNEAVKPLTAQTGAVDATRYLDLFPGPSAQANTTAFNDVIKRSADVLRENPSSKWVDDALLLIGKSYFYQRNFVGAEQKFREVILLDGSLRDEAEFWLARTLLAQENYDAAAAAAQEALGREELSRYWAPRLRLALAEVAVSRRDWEEAETLLDEALPTVRDGDLAARGYFLLGQVRETLGKHDLAATAYREVERRNPIYELSFAAQISQARALVAASETDRALDLLRRMGRDAKNLSSLGQIELLRARALQAAGRTDDAYNVYHALLYGGDVEAGPVRGMAHYRFAEFFRDVDRDFFLASAHFDTAATALGGTVRQGQQPAAAADTEALTPWAITDAPATAAVFKSFRTVAQRIVEQDSLLHLGSLEPAAFDSAITAIRQRLTQEAAARRAAEERAAALAGFEGTTTTTGPNTGQRPPSGPVAGAANNPNGFLSHRDPAAVAQAWQRFVQQWGERPLVPNWRRREALTGAETPFAGDAGDSPRQGPSQAGTPEPELVQLDLSPIPRDSIAVVQMRAARAADRYELGNVLFLAMSRPDSAAYWYRLVIEEDFGEPVAQRALYALAEVQQELGDTVAATGLYQRLLAEYPESEFSGRVRERLGLPPVVEAVVDSVALAEVAYERAYARWQEAAYPDAMRDMFETALAFENTPVAPRALLAAGRIFGEWAERDSLDLYAPVPISIRPDSVSPRVVFPDSSLLDLDDLPVPDSIAVFVPRPLVPADTLAATSDTLAVPSDTLVVPSDTLAVPSDSLAVVPDTRAVPSDTLLVAPEAFAGPPDSLAVSEPALLPRPFQLDALYASIQQHFPDTPHAEQARRLLTVLEENRPVPPPDTTATAPDSLALPADSLVTSLPLSTDSLAAPPDSLAASTQAPEQLMTFPLQDRLVGPGEEPPLPSRMQGEAASELQPEAGGWTWIILSTRSDTLAAQYAEGLRQRGYAASVLPGRLDEQPVFRVGVGQFPDPESAEFARRYYPPNFPRTSWLFRLRPPEDR